MNQKNPSVKYIVFTNDTKKASECMKEWDGNMNVEFVSDLGKFSDTDEFFLMSACQNQIISNSTFSWWAAYLNSYENKQIIAPIIPNASSNIYPDGWTVI